MTRTRTTNFCLFVYFVIPSGHKTIIQNLPRSYLVSYRTKFRCGHTFELINTKS